MWNKDGDKVVRWMYQQKTVDLSVIDDDKRLKLEDFQILKNFKYVMDFY